MHLFLAPKAYGLLSFNDGRDRVFVNASYGISYDSDIFSSKGGAGDFVQNFGAGIEYIRKAGMIGVNSSLSWNFGKFSKFTAQNFADPNFSAKFTKGEGRPIGSLGLQLSRQSRSDTTLNARTESWNYGLDLALKYPINERFYLTTDSAFNLTKYVSSNASSQPLADLTSYSQGAELFYVYNSKLDLFTAYRYRSSSTSQKETAQDHAISGGLTGGIIPKLSGSINIGYQHRQSNSPTDGSTAFDSLFGSIGLAYTASKKLTLDFQATEDFSTTASNVSIDSRSATVHVNYVFTRKFSVNGGATYSDTRFLGLAGQGRHDHGYQLDAGVSYTLTPHIHLNASYNFTRNYSNLEFANYAKRGFTFNVGARY